MIYLASPYSHPDMHVREDRFWQACMEAARMIKAGELVYSPVAHSHWISTFGLPGGWDFWRAHSLAMLRRCDELVVLELDGWQDSEGVRREIEAALAMGIPVRKLEPKEDAPV